MTWSTKKLNDRFQGFGRVMKLYDSYSSEKYFSFGKVASVGTTELPSVYWKIQKTYEANNSFLPLLDDYVGSSLSNAHSAARVSTNPLMHYIAGLVWMYRYLLSTNEYSNLPEESPIAASVVPSPSGGFPIIHLHNIHVRAESDLLALYLDMVRYSKLHYRRLFHVLRRFTIIRKIKNSNLRTLLMDPFSLPIIKPMLPSSKLRLLMSLLHRTHHVFFHSFFF